MSFRTKKPYTRPDSTTNASSDGQWQHDRAPGVSRQSNSNSKATGAAFGAGAPVAAAKLVVSNLHYEITTKDLNSIFGQVGTLVKEPLIRYDRSGRSLGHALVTYETATEATRAKKQFDGILAKGQPMAIAYDTSTSHARRVVSAPGASTASLLNRIERPALATRLSGAGEASDMQVDGGPTRSRAKKGKGGANGNGNGNGNNGAGKDVAKSKGKPNTKAKPKTAEELDKELDAFMGDDNTAAASAVETPGVVGDVEMAV